MKRSVIGAAVAAAGAALVVQPAPVRADAAGSAILARINAAQSARTSFVVKTTGTTVGVASTATIVRVSPAKPGDTLSGIAEKIETTAGALTIETYIVNSTLYVSLDGTTWQKKTLDAAQVKRLTGSIVDGFKANPPVATVQPDRVDGGVTYGDVRVVSATPPSLAALAPSAPKTVTIECMYDKATFLMHECDNEQFSLAFSKYDDPSNTVALPLAAANATVLTIPLPGDPAPAASAPPAR
jgi:hypothetical protein